MLAYHARPERAPPTLSASRSRSDLRVLPVWLAALWIALLLVLITSGSAAALGTDDSCPLPAKPGRNVIVSDGDEPVMRGTAASDLICGDSRANLIIGGILDDEIYGGGGDDILIGGHGIDTLDGGSGNDWLRGGTNRDIYVGGANEVGFDTASFADMTPADGVAGVVIDLRLQPPREREELPYATATAGQLVDRLSQIDKVIGSPFDDTITAAATGVAQMDGGYGDDRLVGTGGDDRMWGEGGSDTCTNDGSAVECLDGQGAHRPASAFVKVDSRAKDLGLLVLGAEGTVNDTLTVTRLSESQLRITGGARIEVGSNCTRTNETTADCTVSAARNVVISGDQGVDRLTTGDNISSGTIDVNGGTGDDTLFGGAGEEVLFSGEGGRDTLTGNNGSDALISEGDVGASGGDSLDAGAGDDQLVTDNACPSHRLIGGADNDVIGFARQTTVNGAAAGVWASFAEGIATAMRPAGEILWECLNTITTISGGEILEGTDYGDVLYGNEGANTIWGREGNDRVYGQGGDDVVRGQDGEDSVTGGAGVDSLYGGNGWDDLHARDGVADTAIECGDDPDPGAERDQSEVPSRNDPAGDGCNDRVPTEAHIELDTIRNGTPGAVSLHGHVLVTNGTPARGIVNINFQKLEGGNWRTLEEHTVQKTLDANGYFEVLNRAVGRGEWRVRAVFNEQWHYARAESPYREFTITLIPTTAFIEFEGAQDGAPGTASAHGHVLRTSNGAPVNGTVKINFQKLEGGNWRTLEEHTVVKTLDANGYWEVRNHPVGVGNWRMRAVFEAQGEYEYSESEYRYFDIQPVATRAYLTKDSEYNGQPGYVSVHGNVQLTNGAPASGTAYIRFEKWENGAWVLKNTATPTLVNGGYDINHREAGAGQWRVRATFPAQGDYAYSESAYVNFDIGTGYRLIGRQSGRCMSLSGNNGANGTAMILWDCSGSPNPGDGQVFTFVPIEAGDQIFLLKINSTGKCVDVSGVSTADGALLQQWDCLGAGQTNQLWDIIPIQGQEPYIALMAQHSGKCADVLGQATGNGARIGQWGCWWGGNQQWHRQSIG